MQVSFNNTTILGNAQTGEINIMNFANERLTEADWMRIESGIHEALNRRTLKKEQKGLLEETEDVVKRRDEAGLKRFLKANGASLLTGTCANVLASGIVNLLAGLI